MKKFLLFLIPLAFLFASCDPKLPEAPEPPVNDTTDVNTLAAIFSTVYLRTLASAPDTPATGSTVIYALSDGFHAKTSTGATAELAGDLEYRATLVGANGSLTSTTVSSTDFTMALTGAYSAEGVYTLTAASGTPFTANKTVVKVFNSNATGGVILQGVVTSTSVITINAFAVDGTTPADAIGSFFVEITVD